MSSFTTRYVCGKCGCVFSSLTDKRYLPCANGCGGIGYRDGEPRLKPALPDVPSVDALGRAIGKAISGDVAKVSTVRFCVDCWKELAATDPGGKTLDNYQLCGACAANDPKALRMVMVRVPADAVAKWKDGREMHTGNGFWVPLIDEEMEQIEIVDE